MKKQRCVELVNSSKTEYQGYQKMFNAARVLSLQSRANLEE
jgi:hypothetical protein